MRIGVTSNPNIRMPKATNTETKGVHVHGHWRHYESGDKVYIAPAVRHIKK